MFTWMAPWGQSIPAELLVMTARSWREHPASSDPAWAAFTVGPAMLAIRLKGDASVPPIVWPTRAPSFAERN
jgi:hypothetical protein